MKLPNAHLAVVERTKLAGYLLNPSHLYGGSKAQFFLSFGFELNSWEIVAATFREHGQRHEVTAQEETMFGPRYEVEGELCTPDGRNPHIRTVWQVDKGHCATPDNRPSCG